MKMLIATLIVAPLILLSLISIAMIAIYNKLVRNRVQSDEGWSGILVQLKRRHDLIPNLINTVKGYAQQENDVLNRIVEARGKSLNSNSIKDQSVAEAAITAGLNKLLAIAESYPDLKSSSNFLELQQELAEIEEAIQNARRYYNGTVREYEEIRNTFPSNLIAANFGFKEREFFELDSESEAAVPKVSF
jgi:LemA protein